MQAHHHAHAQPQHTAKNPEHPAKPAQGAQAKPPVEPSPVGQPAETHASTPIDLSATDLPTVDSPAAIARLSAALKEAEERMAETAARLAEAETRLAETEPRLAEAESRLAETEAHAAEHHEAWLRAKAETENVRRRAQEDVAKASKFAAEKFASAMLPVKDSLEAALATEGQTPEKLREGVELTLKQIVGAFEGVSLAEENPMGQKFDPNKHQAIGAVESEAEPNTVINVLQKGYLLHGRVIRPAMVMVAKAKA